MDTQSPIIEQSNDGIALKFIDFVPTCQTPGAGFKESRFDSYRTLVNRANDWLRHNPLWEIKSCESTKFSPSSDDINEHEKIAYMYSGVSNKFLRGLRLWVKRSQPSKERTQIISYSNLVPELKVKAGVFSHPIYESLDDVLERYNKEYRTKPIPGRIISVETVANKMKKSGEVDVERTNWKENVKNKSHYIFVLRIFFEVSEPKHEEIVITDFTPDLISNGCCTTEKFETFSNVVSKASEWSTRQSQLRLCNFQSVDISITENTLGSQKMVYRVFHDKTINCYLRILRVVHIRQLCDDTVPIPRISFKIFVPVLSRTDSIVRSYGTSESLPETVQGISTWIHVTGAEVLNLQTLSLKQGRMTNIDYSEKTYTRLHSGESYVKYQFFYVIIAYLNGVYEEHPVSEVAREKCCSIS